MNGLSIFFGITGGMLVAALFTTCHGSPWNGGRDSDFSVLIGILAGFYIWFPFHYTFKDERATVLHSDPTSYPVPLKDAFACVREILLNATYGVGDKWRIVIADTNSRQIRANLSFSEGHETHGMGALLNITTHAQYLKRNLELVVSFEEEGQSTKVLVDFTPHVEGSKFYACDKVITDFYQHLKMNLGCGRVLGKRDRPQMLAAPPMWLLGLTVFTTAFYFLRVVTGFMGGKS